ADPSAVRPYDGGDRYVPGYVPRHQVTTLPRVKRQVRPKYTEAGRRAGIEGQVKARIRISAEGRVTDVKIVSGLGYGLDEEAERALRQFVFEPAKIDGRPVGTEILFKITFILD
ncbi:MAG: energy transducer TonB, partial [Deltaproteobacteria bacterium]